MANSITYEVITSSTPVRNRPSHNAKILGYLYQGNTLEVISINNHWAYFKFNKKNAYIDISDIQLVEQVPITGNLTIEYIDTDSQLEIQDSKTYTNLELKSYTYTATEINGYKVYGDTTKTITLTSDNPNQTITFYYEEILGSINIKYIDSKTSQEISTSETYDNLPLLSYTYTAKEINYYEIIEPKTKSVILTEADPNQTVTFSYKKIVGDIIIKYVNKYTMSNISDTDTFNNLEFGEYNYSAKAIDGYTLVGESTITVTLTDNNPIQTIIFEYKITEEVNMDEPPYIATRYVTPTWDINDDVIINFYVTDWNQSDVIDENTTSTFAIEVRVNDASYRYKKYIGENSINIGKLCIGEYELILQATDEYGRKSHELYNEFRIINKEEYELNIINNTHIVTDEELKSYEITKGSYINDSKTAHNTKIGLQNLMNDLSSNGVLKMILPTNTYTIDAEGIWASGVAVQYTYNLLSIPSNFILDLNGSTINQAISTPDQKVSFMMAFVDSYDSHVINGTLEGDYGLREYECLEGFNYLPGEQSGCACIGGESKYCSFENIIVKKFPGYAMTAGISPQNTLISGKGHAILGDNLKFESGDIDNNGDIITSTTKYTSQYLDLSKFSKFNTVRVGQYLGFLYEPHGDSVIVKYSFYDSSKKFIKSIIGHQYRDIRKPNNASYMRCTYIFNKFTNMNNIQLYHMYIPRNCGWYNITFEDTRTCALAPYQGNNMLIDNCTFARCATNITPCAIDFEDGWHNMQDYCIQNCEILEAVGTADLVIVGGLDLIFRNNINWRISSRGFSRGQVFIGNTLINLNLGLTTHLKSAFTICKYNIVHPIDNNLATGFIDNSLDNISGLKLIIDNCTFNKCVWQNYNPNIIVRECTFNWNEQILSSARPIIGGTFYRCTINNFISTGGHIKNFVAYDSIINNMNLVALQGCFILYNCEVNNCSFANYNIDININISNSILKNFIINRIGWAKCNISYNSTNSLFENTSTRKNIFIDDYKYFDNTKTFTITTSKNTYLNDTILATTLVLNNINIDKSKMND